LAELTAQALTAQTLAELLAELTAQTLAAQTLAELTAQALTAQALLCELLVQLLMQLLLQLLLQLVLLLQVLRTELLLPQLLLSDLTGEIAEDGLNGRVLLVLPAEGVTSAESTQCVQRSLISLIPLKPKERGRAVAVITLCELLILA
jgi:hypothetical protein